MQRVCFQLQVRPDRLDGVPRRHAAVWPEMLDALHETGWHNYSLFLRDDGLLVGYFETPDLAAAQAGMAGHRGERPVAGRDGRVLRRARRPRPGRRASSSSTRSSTWRTSWPDERTDSPKQGTREVM